jgi:spore maturation protein CgeB
MRIVILGLSMTSSWGNGHATTYRALARALARRDHQVLFLERDVPWYAENRDLAQPPYCQVGLYASLDALHGWTASVRDADVVIVGSYVPEGTQVIDWVLQTSTGVRAFYDIDTPVTLDALDRGTCDYIRLDQLPRLDVYLSFTGGRVLSRLQHEYGVRTARPLYCAVDPERYRPTGEPTRWDLGYLGTYSLDRQPALDLRLLEPARRWRDGRFVVAGPQFPPDVPWPPNVDRIEHLSPQEHPSFYSAQRFTLNVTRAAMVEAGHAPSVRLFEAAACGTPIISDAWVGLDEFFEPGHEIFVTTSADDTLALLQNTSDRERRAMATRARSRVLARHTAGQRAIELEQYLAELRGELQAPA